jgi:hypothetical protein
MDTPATTLKDLGFPDNPKLGQSCLPVDKKFDVRITYIIRADDGVAESTPFRACFGKDNDDHSRFWGAREFHTR